MGAPGSRAGRPAATAMLAAESPAGRWSGAELGSIVGHAAAAYRLVRTRVWGVDEQRRIRVAVVFGGRSSEHAISCISAGSVLSAIDRTAYDVVPIGITTEGRWVVERDEPERLRITDGRLPAVDATGVARGAPR